MGVHCTIFQFFCIFENFYTIMLVREEKIGTTVIKSKSTS